MKIIGIYKIVSPSKKIYIGQSVDIISRWNGYKGLHFKGQNRLYNSLKKYGAEKHKFEIICQCDISELNNLEKYYIELYQCYNSEFGLNLRDGGLGSKPSEETKKKTSNTLKGRIFSEETKNKIKEKRKLQIFSKETKQKMSKLRIGKTHSEETKVKMSKSLIGNTRNLGKKFSEEHKRKMSEAKRGVKFSEEHKRNLSLNSKWNKTN